MIKRDGLNIFPNGDKYWYLNGLRHREGGPAVEHANGYQEWRINDLLHREDGPAIEDGKYGNKYWYLHGLPHRSDGPATERSDGLNLWYLSGEYIDCDSQEEFERLIKLKAFW